MPERNQCVSTSAVFAYGDVGVRCLKTLLSAGVHVTLVVTHADDPAENRWFDSVAELAAEEELHCIRPDDASSQALQKEIESLQPDFIFSFYYRHLLPMSLLRQARRGALNMHGSLLPRFRGRAPINWAVLRGATQTGATLHYMTSRADAGDIVDQLAVPILKDDTGYDVHRKITVAAEIVLARCLPELIAGSILARPQPVMPGEYFGRRRPEDGRIDWRRPAQEIHNLVRAVAPPYPGAFTEINGQRWTITRTRLLEGMHIQGRVSPQLVVDAAGRCVAHCTDGGLLQILGARSADGALDLARLTAALALASIDLPC
ncbi:formyltransferase [Steroidobacter denitrificans]|uniref:Formyltransferase n=1 Tax=Steroidobacter denitrificans TaxID=465721 RepID=A0A127FA32_STEDE|nr:formyltransferase [Steroidobacter denitrificans]